MMAAVGGRVSFLGYPCFSRLSFTHAHIVDLMGFLREYMELVRNRGGDIGSSWRGMKGGNFNKI